MSLYFLKLESLILAVTTASLIVFLSKNTSLIASTDSLTRLDFNLNNFNNLYFLWTNIDYIYTYFIPLITLLFLVIYREVSNQSVAITNIVLLSVPLFLSKLLTNLNNNIFNDNINNSTNLLLFNSINKYHPLLLYLVVIGIICSSISMFYNSKSAKNTSLNSYYFTTIGVILTAILITMYAGSWWAYQEGSWGGWWAWDPSETFGLLILIGAVALLHSIFLLKKTSIFKLSKLIISAIIVSSYIILQLNFGITSHNFGLKDSDNSLLINVYIFFLYLFILLSYLITVRAAQLNNFTFYYTRAKTTFNYYTALIYILIILSILPLLTDLIWKKFEVNTINFSVNYYLMSGLVLSTLIQWFNIKENIKLSSYILLISLFTISFLSSVYLLFFLALLSLTNFNKVHVTLLLYVLVSWLSNNYIFNYWIENSTLSEFSVLNIKVLNYPLVSQNSLTNLLNSTYSILSISSNAQSGSIFFLDISGSDYAQIFKSDNDRIFITSKTYDNSTFLLLLFFFLLVKYLINFLNSSYIIKC